MVGCFFIWYFGMEWMGYWKMDVDECTAALEEDLNGSLSPEESRVIAVETCLNLKDAGVVR